MCGGKGLIRKRHPDLSLRVSSTISKAQALATDRESLDRYFNLLKETIAENNLKDRPGQIYNLDETGMSLNPKSLKTIHSRILYTRETSVLTLVYSPGMSNLLSLT